MRGSELRILDSKDPQDHEVLSSAPLLADHLSPESAQRFSELLAILAAIGIPYTISPRLVRGLDYYTGTIFEFATRDSQAVLAGGRYDGLVKAFGGPDLSGIGYVLSSACLHQSSHKLYKHTKMGCGCRAAMPAP